MNIIKETIDNVQDIALDMMTILACVMMIASTNERGRKCK